VRRRMHARGRDLMEEGLCHEIVAHEEEDACTHVYEEEDTYVRRRMHARGRDLMEEGLSHEIVAHRVRRHLRRRRRSAYVYEEEDACTYV